MSKASKATRIVFITTVPGSLDFVREPVRYVQALGFDVHALSSPGEWLQHFAVDESVVIHAVEMPRQITPLRDLVAVFRIWRCLLRLHPQIVHAGTPKGGLLGMIGAYLTKTPVRVYQIYGLPFITAKGYKRKLLRWSEKISCLLAHQVFVVSHSVLQVALEEGFCSPEKAKFIPLYVDAIGQFNPENINPQIRYEIRAKYGIPPDAPVVSFVGRIVRDKGLIELVDAWKVLREDFPSLHLLVVGRFEPQDPIPSDVEVILRTDPRIHLTGFIDNVDIPPIYSAIDVFVLPSYREGLPLTLLETAAMEVAVVATRIPGCVDAVQDGVTGTLVPPCDFRALADAIRAYLNDPDLRRRHGCAGRERVLQEFRPEAICEAMYQEYAGLLLKNGIPVSKRLSEKGEFEGGAPQESPFHHGS